MIPTDFRDYFINNSSMIISRLLSLSLESNEIKDSEEKKVITSPHCSNKHIKTLMVN